jgi:hypothetical protein
MGFALFVELLNMRFRKKHPKALAPSADEAEKVA